MHTVGGVAMMSGGPEGRRARGCRVRLRRAGITLGITVLTSMSQAALGRYRRHPSHVRAGRRCSPSRPSVPASPALWRRPQEAAMLREVLGPEGYIVTPGVRPAGSRVGRPVLVWQRRSRPSQTAHRTSSSAAPSRRPPTRRPPSMPSWPSWTSGNFARSWHIRLRSCIMSCR